MTVNAQKIWDIELLPWILEQYFAFTGLIIWHPMLILVANKVNLHRYIAHWQKIFLICKNNFWFTYCRMFPISKRGVLWVKVITLAENVSPWKDYHVWRGIFFPVSRVSWETPRHVYFAVGPNSLYCKCVYFPQHNHTRCISYLSMRSMHLTFCLRLELSLS